MNYKNLRIGDWVIDPKNYNRPMKMDAQTIGYAGWFTGLPILKNFWKANGLKDEELDGKVIYYKEKNGAMVSVHNLSDGYKVIVRNGEYKYEGVCNSVHEYQHALADCQIDWEVCVY